MAIAVTVDVTLQAPAAVVVNVTQGLTTEAADARYLTPAAAAESFLTPAQAAEEFVTPEEAAAAFMTPLQAAAAFMTPAQAAAAFLTHAQAAGIYQTQAALDSRVALSHLAAIYNWSQAVGDYTATHVGTGAASTATQVLQVSSGATAGSVGFLRGDANNFRAWYRTSSGRGQPDWRRRTVYHVKLSSDNVAGADTIFRLQLGLPFGLTTAQDLQAANKAVGFKIVAGEIFVQVANGSAVTTVSTGVTMAAYVVCDLTLDCVGDGTWSATVNSTTVTGTGAPAAEATASESALVLSSTNGTTSGTRRFFVHQQKTMQF